MKGKRLKIILCFLAVLVTGLHASTDYYFKRIPMQKGSDSEIRCIFFDRFNFIWAGTDNALLRVDDQVTKRFEHDAGNPYSLPKGSVKKIVEDRLHRMWVLTAGGTACFRSGNSDFLVLKKSDGSDFVPSDLCVASDGMLFICVDGIYKYTTSDGSLHRLCRTLKPYPWDSHIVAYDSKTAIYLGTGNHVMLVDCHTGKTRRAPFARNIPAEYVYVDAWKRIWVSGQVNDGNLYCYDFSGRLIHLYALPQSKIGNVVLCMSERNGRIIVGTDGSGVYEINPITYNIVTYRHVSADNLFAIPTNSVCSMGVDRYNTLWLGTVRFGLLCAYPVAIRTFYEVPFGNEHGLSNGTVQCFCEETPDRIWMGTDGGGLDLFMPSTQTFRHFTTTYDEKIASMCYLQPGKLLLKVFSRGLFTFDTSTGQLTPFIISDPQTSKELEEYTLAAEVHQLDSRSILILSAHSSVFRYDLTTRRVRRMEWPEGMKYDGGKLGFIENVGRYTYLHDGLRIYQLDNETLTIRMVCQFKGRRLEIHTAVRGLKGNFWIGSNKGLCLYLTHEGRVIAMRSQLVKNVNSLVTDNRGRLWLTTDNMVFAFIRKTRKFLMFGETDGVLRNEFLSRVCMRASSGDIYLAGTSGVVHIDKDFWVNNVQPPRVQLSDLTVNGKMVEGVLDRAEPTLRVKWNSNVSIRVMSLESSLFRQKAYRFLISGYSDKYTETFSPSLDLRSLPAGNYDILVSVMQQDGNWTLWRNVLELHTLPPWYRNLWFISFCILFVVAGIYFISRSILLNRDEHLKWELEERDRQAGLDKMRFLVDITHELRTPLTLIHAPLDRILKSMPSGNACYPVLQGLQRQTIRMKHLINMVLDVHRMETTETRLHMHPNNLNEWLRQVTDDFAKEGVAQGIETVYDLDGRIGTVSFDNDKCDMVLNNLLGNALKHSSKGGHIYVRTKLNDDGTRVRISISDEGPGMKGADPARLFQRFYQGGNETVGSGIGLSYSKILGRTARRHHRRLQQRRRGGYLLLRTALSLTAATEIVNEPHPYLSELVSAELRKTSGTSVRHRYDLSRYRLLDCG
jgi:signal transduction histidine kinase/ligand-binding sensor domain-containing protein